MRPWKHLFGLTMTYGRYPVTTRTTTIRTNLFTGDQVQIPLPAGLDIYLTGLKSHDSELRLVKFLFNHIKPGMTVIDGGAHLGYFSIVLARLTGQDGQVVAFEPSDEMFPFLVKNTGRFTSISREKKMLAETPGKKTFYQFPTLYSEYNTGTPETIDPELRAAMSTIEIEATSLDVFAEESGIRPGFIKLDLEGGEMAALHGARQLLQSSRPLIAVEMRLQGYDDQYAPIVALMERLGYGAHAIDDNGQLKPITSVYQWLVDLRKESDNIIFRHETA